MMEKPSYVELEEQIAQLRKDSAEKTRLEKINHALFSISNATSRLPTLDELFRSIHRTLSDIIDTTNFYIALYRKSNDSVTFPYCVDSVDESYPPVVAVSKTESLTAEVIRSGRPVMVTKSEILNRRRNSQMNIPSCTPSEIWLGVPLTFNDDIIGVMAVQSYDNPKCYDQTDLKVMVSVAEQVAFAIERKRLEKKLIDQIDFTEHIFNSTDIHLAVVGPDGIILAVNNAWRDFARKNSGGDESKWGVGASYFVPSAPDSNDIESARNAYEGIRSVQQGLRPKFRMEYPCPEPENHHQWFDMSVIPLTGKPGTVVVAHTNITQQKRSEEKLRKNEKRFRRISQLTNDVVYACNHHQNGSCAINWISGNSEKLIGYSSDEIKQRSCWRSLVIDEDHPIFEKNFLDISHGHPASSEMRLRHKNGEIVWVNFFARCSGNSEDIGEFNVYGGMQNITERKQSEEERAALKFQLIQAQKMEAVGSLAGGIAHDLNNILSPIIGLSEILLDEISTESDHYEYTTQILKSATRGSDLVKHILAFSRQSKAEKLPIRIQPVLKEVLSLMRASISSHIEITSHIDTQCGMISADPTQIHQILMNLITNASHAVEENGGIIDVRLETRENDTTDMTGEPLPSGRYACITVADTGIGIDPALIDKIFDPYFTTKADGKGTGIGLSVVYGIVKDHGGHIQVDSRPQEGTKLSVYLPLMENVSAVKESALAERYPTGNECILLVDDEEPILLSKKMMLQKLGYHVTVRSSSIDALEAFRANSTRFDLMITDNRMPGMTGVKLALKVFGIRPEMPIIICTGFSDEIDEKHVRKVGVKSILKKPVTLRDLSETVRNVLDGSVE